MGFPNFIGHGIMTALYMDWNDNATLHFNFSLKDLFGNGMSYPRFSTVNWNPNKQLNL